MTDAPDHLTPVAPEVVTIQDADQARESRDELAAKMTPDQIAEAQKMAREWAPK
jgi:hypothetical protein